MMIYFDGGIYDYPKAEKRKVKQCTYGILLHKKECDPIEKQGKYDIPSNHSAIYEYVAFLEAFKLLKEEGLNYKDVSFYTDSEDIAYAQTYLHKDNYMIKRCERFLSFLDMAINFLGMQEDKENLIDCLSNARFLKVKAHTYNMTVDNIRVDYLSKSAHTDTKPISYNKFLQAAFFKYKDTETIVSFNLPFMPENKKNMIKM